MSAQKIAIHWFRQDLRLTDNPALHWLCENDYVVVPLYILEDKPGRPLGGASKWWLHHSLEALGTECSKHHMQLVLRKDDPEEVLRALQKATGAELITWNRMYDRASIERDKGLKENFEAKSFSGALLREPWEIETKNGSLFKVYTPFWNALSAEPQKIRRPFDRPSFSTFGEEIQSDALDDWGLLPTQPNWAKGFEDEWTVGELAAQERLEEFLDGPIREYGILRDRPDIHQTSKLSPYLHWGEISPHQIWHRVHEKFHPLKESEITYVKELVWREFSYHLLYHFPELNDESLQENFKHFPWNENEDHLQAWQKGQTGVPIVDAGMRQLWHTGWMHNRVRMIVASYLIKNLLLPWQKGEEWFWDTLVDADLASNGASWQWVAGSSPHSAPFYRIFNPITQAEKFDGDGVYIHRWVPELKNLKPPYLFDPSAAPRDILQEAGIVLGEDYPRPLVDLKESRSRAMEALQHSKEGL